RDKPPIIIMAPGLLGTKEGPLETFARRFLSTGYAVLTLDFRSFGGSSGEPRHHLDPLRQVDDYRMAIAFVAKTLAGRVDTSRIVLWGSSFSGSAAILAARDAPAVAAVIAQVPYLGGRPIHAPDTLQIASYVLLSVGEELGDALAR